MNSIQSGTEEKLIVKRCVQAGVVWIILGIYMVSLWPDKVSGAALAQEEELSSSN